MRICSMLLCGMVIASAICATSVRAQTTVAGSSLTLNSNADLSTSLFGPGYLGTFINVPDSGDGGAVVNLTLNASRGASGSGVDPHMNLVIADSKYGFSIGNTSATDYSTGNAWFPAGTYVVRAERNYSTDTSSYSATVNSLTVTGATVSNVTGNTALNNASLAAADTYIQNFRKGDATVHLPGVVPGTSVSVDLKRHAFNFGTAVPGSIPITVDRYFGTAGTVIQTEYQARLNQNFNAIVPENAGKWEYNQVGLSGFNMAHVDLIMNYAQQNNMRARQHNLIWANQQPTIINSLLALAVDDPGPADDAEVAFAKTELRNRISSRIDYYVGTGAPADRAHQYIELDVFNESSHTGSDSPTPANYWNVFGAEGIASIYHEAAQAIAASGASTKLFVNEYSVLNADYGRWYSEHITELRNAGVAAGYGDVVGGIGVQHHTFFNTARNTLRTLQNLSTHGLPMVLTEFSVAEGGEAFAATVLDQTLRQTFGTADTTGFFIWGFQDEGNDNLFNPGAALYRVNPLNFTDWTITEAGMRWQDLLGIQDWDDNPDNAWTTHLTTTVNPDGTIDFNGFYGDYTITINGQEYLLTINKGTETYLLTVPEPATLLLAVLALPAVAMLRRRSSP